MRTVKDGAGEQGAAAAGGGDRGGHPSASPPPPPQSSSPPPPPVPRKKKKTPVHARGSDREGGQGGRWQVPTAPIAGNMPSPRGPVQGANGCTRERGNGRPTDAARVPRREGGCVRARATCARGSGEHDGRLGQYRTYRTDTHGGAPTAPGVPGTIVGYGKGGNGTSRPHLRRLKQRAMLVPTRPCRVTAYAHVPHVRGSGELDGLHGQQRTYRTDTHSGASAAPRKPGTVVGCGKVWNGTSHQHL